MSSCQPTRGALFPIICGTSGAVNAAVLAADAHNFRRGVRRLMTVWKNMHVGHIYRERNIDAGHLAAFSVTCSGYTSGQSVTYQGKSGLENWKRAGRIGVAMPITHQHLEGVEKNAVERSRKAAADQPHAGSHSARDPRRRALSAAARRFPRGAPERGPRENRRRSRRGAAADHPPAAAHGRGLERNASTLLSYLLFERGHCRALIRLGYGDTMSRREELLAFLRDTEPAH